ncbi:MAG: hypothetical protein QXE31_01530 [Candidatus Woesearchaeota archaeon]
MVDQKKVVDQKKQEPEIPKEITTNIEELMHRLRLLEERFSNLRKKSDFIEQTILKDTKDIFEEINVLESNLSELKNEISELSEKMIKLTEEINQTVKKSEFNVLAKYLEFWQPMEFLTKEEAKKLLNEIYLLKKEEK